MTIGSRGVQPEAQHASGAGASLPCRKVRIIRIQNGSAIGWQAIDDFTFGTDNTLEAAEALKMRSRRVGENGDVRHGQSDCAGNLAEPACTKLHDGTLVTCVQREECQWDPDVIVQIASCHQHFA